MNLEHLEKLCLDAGLRLHECCGTHYQIRKRDTPLVDVWPSTNRFRACGAKEGKKSTAGTELSAVELAKHSAPHEKQESVDTVPDPMQPLIDLFRGEESVAGQYGDDRNWTPAQTAVWLIGELRKREVRTQPVPAAKSTDGVIDQSFAHVVFTIEVLDKNDFTVRHGERYQDKLCWDEMLGTIARLTLDTSRNIGWLRTEAEHAKTRYSTAGDNRFREQAYSMCCGVGEEVLRVANDKYQGDTLGRLRFVVNSLEVEQARMLTF